MMRLICLRQEDGAMRLKWVRLLGGLVVVVGAIALLSYAFGRDGETIRETRSVTGFDEVRLAGSGELIITQGADYRLEVEAGPRALAEIVTEVDGNTLELRQRAGWLLWEWWRFRAPKYHLTVPDLAVIRTSGSAEIVSDGLAGDSLRIVTSGSGDAELTLDVDSLEVEVSGSADFNLSGRADTQRLKVSGSADYAAEGLISRDADIQISGSGDAEVFVLDTLRVRISGSGDVGYIGSPRIDQQVSGSGDVTQIRALTEAETAAYASDDADDDGATEPGEAVVESVDILTLESFPVQIRAEVEGYLPDGCSTLGDPVVRREGDVFIVTLPATRPADALCTTVIQPFAESVALDVYGLAAGTYGVIVNDVETSFTLATDNVLE
jgi:hypothetical protein